MTSMFKTETFVRDFSPTGLKLEGGYENDRNQVFSPLYKAMIREAYQCEDVICGHHLIYVARDKRPDGFVYETVQEIPSADALIFDHEAMTKLFGVDAVDVMIDLASVPVKDRDERLNDYFWSRQCSIAGDRTPRLNEWSAMRPATEQAAVSLTLADM